MSHIDTLQVYKEYIAAGYTEAQSSAAVKALNASFDSVVTKDELRSALKDLEKDLKFFILWVIGGAFAAAFLIPVLQTLPNIITKLVERI
jgi:hypothetical protein